MTTTSTPLRIGTAGLSLWAAFMLAGLGLGLLAGGLAARLWLVALGGLGVLATLVRGWRRRAPVVLEATHLVVQYPASPEAFPLSAVADVRARWARLALRFDVVVRFDAPAPGPARQLRFAPAALVELGAPPTIVERVRAAAVACGAHVRGA